MVPKVMYSNSKTLPVLILLLGTCLPAFSAGTAPEPPRLVVVIVVDQFSAEVFDRLDSLYVGGLETFSKEGVRYRNAEHDHAITHTGPGHFVLMSGRHPGPGGVPANDYYDRTLKRIVYCVEDPAAASTSSREHDVSYRNIPATALGDWMKKANPQSKVYSVAGKDRSAILLGGKHPDAAFWFDPRTARFTTNAYYADDLPSFAPYQSVQVRAMKFFNRAWDRLLPDKNLYEKFAGPDDAPGEGLLSDREDSPVFPHVLRTQAGLPDSEWYGRIMNYPWMDILTLNFARDVVEAGGLGLDSAPDMLCVSLSAFDYIGHVFGPNSQEVMDAAMRLDRAIGSFRNDLISRLGRDQVLFVLTSDHGAQPLVEWAQAHGTASVRCNGEVKKFRDKVFGAFEKKYPNAEKLFLFRGQENIYFDHADLAARGIALREVCDLVRGEAKSETWIAEVFDREQLLSPKNLGVIGERVKHSFNPEKGPDIFLIPKPYFYTVGGERGRAGTSHGTPYTYDSRVPLIFLWSRLEPKTVDRPVRTVDLAPTLAEILNVPAPKNIDGQPLEEFKSLAFKNIPAVSIPRSAGEVKADGRLTEDVWKNAAQVKLVDNQSGGAPHARTTVRLFHDTKYLWVGFSCADTDVSAEMTARDDNLWREEAVEIFLDPAGGGREYLEIEVNPRGAVYDAWIQYDTNIDFDKAKTFDLAEIRVGAGVDGALNDPRPDTGWTCEIGIPLDEVPAQITGAARLNLTRIDRVSGKHVYQAWSPTFRWFHVPDRFGTAVFRK